jgi:hypothetical protein
MTILSAPIVVALFALNRIPLPCAYTRVCQVDKSTVVLVLLLFIFFGLLGLYVNPIRSLWPRVLCGKGIRRLLAFLYFLISFTAITQIALKLEMCERLLANPFLAILSFGALLSEEKMLLYFFLGIFSLLALSLMRPEDGKVLTTVAFLWASFSCLFYVILGRREVALMLIIMLGYRGHQRITSASKVRFLIGMTALGALALGISSIRSNATSDAVSNGLVSIDTIVEELSPLPLSAYVLEQGGINDAAIPFTGLTPLRLLDHEVSKSISAGFFSRESDSGGIGPVIGIVGISIEYWLVVPVLLFIIIVVLAKTAWYNYGAGFGDQWRVLSIFLSFKIFTLMRDGEFAIVLMDIAMFAFLFMPLLVVRFPDARDASGEMGDMAVLDE